MRLDSLELGRGDALQAEADRRSDDLDLDVAERVAVRDAHRDGLEVRPLEDDRLLGQPRLGEESTASTRVTRISVSCL